MGGYTNYSKKPAHLLGISNKKNYLLCLIILKMGNKFILFVSATYHL